MIHADALRSLEGLGFPSQVLTLLTRVGARFDPTQCSESRALNQKAYMLFYQRHTPHAGPEMDPNPSSAAACSKSKDSHSAAAPVARPRFVMKPSGEQERVQADGARWPQKISIAVHLPGVMSVTLVKTRARMEVRSFAGDLLPCDSPRRLLQLIQDKPALFLLTYGCGMWSACSRFFNCG